jgi:hypothetical protein
VWEFQSLCRFLTSLLFDKATANLKSVGAYGRALFQQSTILFFQKDINTFYRQIAIPWHLRLRATIHDDLFIAECAIFA